jgi:hypothetical protein
MSQEKLTLSLNRTIFIKSSWILKVCWCFLIKVLFFSPTVLQRDIRCIGWKNTNKAWSFFKGDKECTHPELHCFIIPEGCHWNSYPRNKLNERKKHCEAWNKQKPGIPLFMGFWDTQWSNKTNCQIAMDLIEHFLTRFPTWLVDPDILGQVQEYLIKHLRI